MKPEPPKVNLYGFIFDPWEIIMLGFVLVMLGMGIGGLIGCR